jgi:hypothetical protein
MSPSSYNATKACRRGTPSAPLRVFSEVAQGEKRKEIMEYRSHSDPLREENQALWNGMQAHAFVEDIKNEIDALPSARFYFERAN